MKKIQKWIILFVGILLIAGCRENVSSNKKVSNGKSVKVQHSVMLTNEDKSKVEDAIAEKLYEIFTSKIAN